MQIKVSIEDINFYMNIYHGLGKELQIRCMASWCSLLSDLIYVYENGESITFVMMSVKECHDWNELIKELEMMSD